MDCVTHICLTYNAVLKYDSAYDTAQDMVCAGGMEDMEEWLFS